MIIIPEIVFCQMEKDTILLKEVVLVGKSGNKKVKMEKVSNTLEEYLGKSSMVELVKRGGYAWEPLVNNMLSERAVITIDGMRIFGACTDKMDPVTSYVETSNISQIDIESGQEGGSCGAVCGSVDLVRGKGRFSNERKFEGNVENGYESNNGHKFWLGKMGYYGESYWGEGSISYRKAGNYMDGNGREIRYSQFEKINGSANVGVRVSGSSVLVGDFIFDKAVNVGYPALPMDISLAQTFIGGVSYKYFFESEWVRELEAKIYYNTIKHTMDDTGRDEGDKFPIHMDMPGWSDTYGGYAKMKIEKGDFEGEVNVSGYRNLLKAEMTMYYKNGARMFMYTWPEVSSTEGSIGTKGEYKLGENGKVVMSLGGSVFRNYVESDVGFNLNKIFWPEMEREKVRFLPSVSGKYVYSPENWTFSAGAGYGHRAPSVSEGYGFYLFNSFDGYDYIGNPELRDEISHDVSVGAKYEKEGFLAEAKATGFYIKNYIFGSFYKEGKYQMTPLDKKNGVKRYENLDSARQVNCSLRCEYEVLEDFVLVGNLGYGYGEDFKGRNLPFIRPLNYLLGLRYKKGNFEGEIDFTGDSKQVKYSQAYGEDSTPAYNVVNVQGHYVLPAMGERVSLEAGVENVFDRYYSTYGDWNNFPRMGRNVHFGVRVRI